MHRKDTSSISELKVGARGENCKTDLKESQRETISSQRNIMNKD